MVRKRKGNILAVSTSAHLNSQVTGPQGIIAVAPLKSLPRFLGFRDLQSTVEMNGSGLSQELRLITVPVLGLHRTEHGWHSPCPLRDRPSTPDCCWEPHRPSCGLLSRRQRSLVLSWASAAVRFSSVVLLLASSRPLRVMSSTSRVSSTFGVCSFKSMRGTSWLSQGRSPRVAELRNGTRRLMMIR